MGLINISLFKRSSFSIVTNILRSLFAFIALLILARGLGPEEYGVYAFLIGVFASIKILLDLGASSAFYTFLSKNIKPRIYYSIYYLWILFQLSFALIIIIFIPDNISNILWKGETTSSASLAFVAIFAQQTLWPTAIQKAESQKRTIIAQTFNALIYLLHLLLIICMYYFESLTVNNVLLLIIFEFSIFYLLSLIFFPISISKDNINYKVVLREYITYCLPLAPYAGVSMIVGFLDLWILQHYGGPIEQSFFAISMQFSGISLLFCTATLKIYWNSISSLNYEKKFDELKLTHNLFSRYLLIISVVISGAMMPWSYEILLLLYGTEYQSAYLLFTLMFLYPIHQSIAQLIGSTFYALEETKRYVLISSTILLMGTFITLYLVSDLKIAINGLNLLSLGLGIKFIVTQFLTFFVLSNWLNKNYQIKTEFIRQFIIIILFLTIGYVSYLSSNSLLYFINSDIIIFFISQTIYLCLIIAIIIMMPSIILTTRMDIKNFIINFRLNKTQ